MKKIFFFPILSLIMYCQNVCLAQTVSINNFNTPFTQNFDGLSNTAGSTTNSLSLNGWYMTETGGGARDNEQYAVDIGSSNSGDTYSYGSAANTDRALGSLRSGSLSAVYGVSFTNNTGSVIQSLTISYKGEQWRLGTIARTDKLDFSYSTNATDLVAGVWNDVDALDFVTPNLSTTGAKDGNASVNQSALNATINNLSIPNGATFWIRWSDADATGADDGLAVDDFSITAIPGLPVLSINDVSVVEGNAGTSIATFTVKSSSKAPAGGFTFDISTADNASAVAGTDYVAKSLTGQMIPEGDSTFAFEVEINGDIDSETDETFLVNISNVSLNAVAGDALGQCIITNDDAALPILTVNDVSIVEGDAGSTTATFTVSLASPAPAGGVSFTINTADESASGGSDYTTILNEVGSIAEGETTASITVNILGDNIFEPNETFVVNLSALTNAQPSDIQGQCEITNDDIVRIHSIQGTGLSATLTGIQTVRGVVTRTFLGATSLNGFFMQEKDEDIDDDPNTSEGIFVYNPPISVVQGDFVEVTGTVIDFSTSSSGITSLLTEFSPTTSVTVLSSGNTLPTPINVTLPVSNISDLEKYEGMLVNVSSAKGNLVVTDNYNLGRYGQIVLAAQDSVTNQPGTDARIDQYTQFNSPSVSGNAAYLAAVAKRTIIVDDANGSQNIDPILFGRGGTPLSASNTLRTGDAVSSVTTVLDHRFEGYRLQSNRSSDLNILPTNPRPTTPDLTGNPTLIVGNMNVLNYFNGNGLGGGFPTARGANTLVEFARQKEKIVQSILNSGADILSLNEIENDGFGAQSAIQDLVNGLNAIAGANTWAFVSAPAGTVISTDQITVGMIYKPSMATPVGDLKALSTGEFVQVGRAALAQTFKQNSDGAMFTLVGNHFKSKGTLNAGIGNSDIGDGQANNNGQRTRQAQELATWLATKPTGTNDPDYLIVGDLNAYAKEDPLTALETQGYSTLIPISNTSYQFGGAHGALDHALGNASLAAQVTSAKKWNINADEPTALDYNIQLDNGTIIKTATQIEELYDSDQYRNSDHDPVLVGLKLLCDKPTASIVSDPLLGTACQGVTVKLTGSGGSTYSWNGNAFGTASTYDVSANGTSTVKLIVKNTAGCSSEEVEKIVTITPNTENITSITECGTFTWANNGQTYSQSGTYLGTTTNCVTEKLILTINPLPVPIFENTNFSTCTNQTYLVSTSQAFSEYNWNNEGFGFADNYELSSGGTVTLKVKDTNGCISEEISQIITFNPVVYPTNTLSQNAIVEGETDFVSDDCKRITMINTAGLTNPATGTFNAKVWIENAPLSGPYVARHYQISPDAIDGQTGNAKITLFFTQAEFDAYNALTSLANQLPASAIDTAGINRLRIVKFPGVSSDGLGLPASYTGEGETINPADTDVIFEDGVWKITFSVSSFSGFFVNGQAGSLSVKLLDFKVSQTVQNENVLVWNTTEQVGLASFEVQKSTSDKVFETIEKVNASNFLQNKYQFVDKQPNESINYYRLKIINTDSTFEYSKAIAVNNNEKSLQVGEFYPNPSNEQTSIFIKSIAVGKCTIVAYDLAGKMLQKETHQLTKGENFIKYNTKLLPKGIVLVRINTGNALFYRKLVVE